MYLMKKVAKRSVGMQLKLTKFHGVLHLADDILNFGVPMEVDTGSNESGHKPTKTAARLTQKNEDTFDQQTAIRLEELHLLDMANLELEGRPLFNYGYHNAKAGPKNPPPPENVAIGGSELTVIMDPISQQLSVITSDRNEDDGDGKVETGLVTFVNDLQIAVKGYLPSVPLRSVHKRQGQIFRGQNKFRGQVWRDWALIDWGEEGELPCKIWGFVDLRALPRDHNAVLGNLPLEQSIYAIVETSAFVEDDEKVGMSEIFVPITKEIGGITNNAVSQLKFHLADVDAIVKPIAVVPDIGGEPNAYFMVQDRETWRTDFIAFLERPANEEEEISTDEESDA
jgi:hypothetical protein